MSNGIDIVTPIGDIKVSQNEPQSQLEQESTASKIGWILTGALLYTIIGYFATKTIESIVEDTNKSKY